MSYGRGPVRQGIHPSLETVANQSSTVSRTDGAVFHIIFPNVLHQHARTDCDDESCGGLAERGNRIDVRRPNRCVQGRQFAVTRGLQRVQMSGHLFL